ncbi:hypothetical protein HanIR_Chr10g0487401 [Helianthus annuus]|nr:hypothetical protein HanIR_Chr10g0487401 [Helianthus annuus]
MTRFMAAITILAIRDGQCFKFPFYYRCHRICYLIRDDDEFTQSSNHSIRRLLFHILAIHLKVGSCYCYIEEEENNIVVVDYNSYITSLFLLLLAINEAEDFWSQDQFWLHNLKEIAGCDSRR